MTLVNRFPGVAVITGAGGSGIGAATAKAFATAGCLRFAITDVNKASLSDTQKALRDISPKVDICAVDGDVSDESFLTPFVKEAAGAFGRIDYAVSCAGVLGKGVRSHDTTTEEFNFINNVNYRGSWLLSREVLRHMIKQNPLPEHPKQRGSIVHIASQLGLVGRPAAAPYCASKAAVINMTKSDAIDCSQDDIRINCVCPGVIATPMTMRGGEIDDRLRSAVDIAPMRRMGTPEEVADAVLFLSSGQSSFIQGHALVVDGGYTIN